MPPRALVLLPTLALLACSRPPDPVPQARPTAARDANPETALAAVDEAVAAEVIDALGARLERHIDALAKRRYADQDAFRRAVATTLPTSPEAQQHTAAVLQERGVDPVAYAQFVADHPEVMARLGEQLGARVERAAKRLAAMAPRPPPAWRPVATAEELAAVRAEATRTERGVALFFCAAWAMSCKLAQHEGLWSHPEVVAALESYLPARVDLTDGELGFSKSLGVDAVPALVVWPPGARLESSAHTHVGALDVATLIKVLARRP